MSDDFIKLDWILLFAASEKNIDIEKLFLCSEGWNVILFSLKTER